MEIYRISDTGTALKFSEGVVAVNFPESPAGNRKVPVPDVILTTYSVPVKDWETVFTAQEEGQKVFSGAGEFEKNGLFARGYSSSTMVQGNELQTTSWCIEGDGVRVSVLGDLDEKKDAQHVASEVGDADVLILLCNSTKDRRLDAASIAGVAASLQVRLTVLIGTDEDLKKKIAKELGGADEVTGQCAVKKKDLLEGQSRVVVLD